MGKLFVGKLFAKVRRASRRGSHFLKTGYWHTHERVNPDFPDANFVNHFKVYKFTAQFVQGKRVLDVGSGTGYGSDYLARFASSVIGIDYSESAIRVSKARYSRPEFRVMDAHKLEFPDSSFDFIISTENFEHLSGQAAHLRELGRVLAPGGMALIATPNPEVSGGPNKFHFKENSYEELRELLGPVFGKVEILENSLPHNLDRPHGKDPASEPLLIFAQPVDKTYLSNTHSFFCFCRHEGEGQA
jgi:SAM-dependent methyltransferase